MPNPLNPPLMSSENSRPTSGSAQYNVLSSPLRMKGRSMRRPGAHNAPSIATVRLAVVSSGYGEYGVAFSIVSSKVPNIDDGMDAAAPVNCAWTGALHSSNENISRKNVSRAGIRYRGNRRRRSTRGPGAASQCHRGP